MSSIAVSAAEVRGLTPYTSLAELRDLFTQAGPVLQITATSNFAKDTLSAVVFFEGADAAIQATHLFQGYSLRSTHPLLVTPATGLALQLCGIAQHWQNSPTASAFSSPLAVGLTLDGCQLPAGQYMYSAPSSASSSLAAGSATTSLERSLLALNLGSYAGLPAEFSPVDRASFGDAPPLPAGSDWHHQAAAAYPLSAPALAHHLHHQEGFAPGAALDVVSHRLRRALMNRPTGDGPSGASKEPTVKLWLGGIDGTATLETVQAIFSLYGPVVDKELQPARHERGRTDQWGFVVFKYVDDSKRAYDSLVGEVIPELTGTRRLKLQYRHPDMRRMR